MTYWELTEHKTNKRGSLPLLVIFELKIKWLQQHLLWSQDLCNPNEAEFSLTQAYFFIHPPKASSLIPPGIISPVRVLIGGRRRSHASFETLTLIWKVLNPEKTYMERKKSVKDSLIEWIGSCTANTVHIYNTFTGINFCPPHSPTLGAWFALQTIPPCTMMQISHLWNEK